MTTLGPLRRVVARGLEDLMPFEEEWSAALSACPNTTVHMSFPWIREWLRCFENLGETCIHVVRDDAGIAGIAPWFGYRREKAGIALRAVRLLGNEFSTRAEIVTVRRVNEVAASIIDALDGLEWSLVELSGFSGSSRFLEHASDSLSDHGINPVHRCDRDLPLVNVSCSWEKYLAGRSANFRRSVARNLRVSRKLEPRAFPDDGMNLEELFADIESCSSKTWKHGSGTSLAANEVGWAFYRNVMRAYLDDGGVVAVVLYDGARPVAFVFGIVFNEVMYLIKTGYDQSYSSAGPGFRVLSEMMQRAFRRGDVQRVDLDSISGYGDYKRRWATELRRCRDFYLFRRRLPSAGLAVGYRLLRLWRLVGPGSVPDRRSP